MNLNCASFPYQVFHAIRKIFSALYSRFINIELIKAEEPQDWHKAYDPEKKHKL